MKSLKKDTFVKGTIIASAAIIITKIIGVLYVIPFYKIIGEDGGVLYSYAYNVYNLFLNISTAGIPIAISMIISEYNTQKMYEAKERSYKIAKKIVIIFSAICFLLVFFGSDLIAYFFITDATEINLLNNISFVLKAVSICLLIAPFLSIIRGYLQGHKFIAPSSISQVIEQIVRVFIVIIGSYTSIYILKQDVTIGVAVALLGAFFGGLVAYLFLKIKVNKNKELFQVAEKKDNISSKEIVKKIISYAIPLIIISIVSDLYNVIDMALILKGLSIIGYQTKEASIISSIIATWAPKICMIIVAISMALTTSLIPFMISSYIKKDFKDLNNKFNQAVSTMLIMSIPMATGLFLLADDVYYLFYGPNAYGALILKYIAILNIFVGVLSVINTALQGIKKFKIIYLNSIIGLTVNTILDIPLIILFNYLGWYPFYGTITATIIGCIISYIIILTYLNKNLKFNYKPILNNLCKIIIPTIAMITIILLLKLIIPSSKNLVLITIQIIIYTIVGAITYITISYKNGVLNDVFGKEYINNILKKLHLKNKED